MKNNRGLSVVLLIPTIIIGIALIEEFDFENFSFDKPALAIIYFVGFALSIIFQFRNFKKRPEDNND